MAQSAQALSPSHDAPNPASTARGAGAAAPLASSTTPWWELPWESFRCRTCQRLLLKLTAAALAPAAALEVKCRDCKTLNYLMGPARGDR